jgi:hypothetical protein
LRLASAHVPVTSAAPASRRARDRASAVRPG